MNGFAFVPRNETTAKMLHWRISQKEKKIYDEIVRMFFEVMKERNLKLENIETISDGRLIMSQTDWVYPNPKHFQQRGATTRMRKDVIM